MLSSVIAAIIRPGDERMAESKKTKKLKEEKYYSEEQTEVMRFVKILIVVIILIVIVYFLTRIFVTKDLLNSSEEETPITEGTINYTVTSIGSLLNKPEEEYYVIIYDTENLRSAYYSGLVTNYNNNEGALKVYYANLNSEFNSRFYDPENINLDVSNISDLRVGDITLLKIENNRITESWDNEEQIAEELAYTRVEDTEN